MSLNVAVEAIEGGSIARVSGRLDSASSATLEKELLGLFEAPQSRVLADLGALGYVSSAGLRVFLLAAKRARQVQGKLVLCALQPHVQEVFEMSGFSRILEIAADASAGRAKLAA